MQDLSRNILMCTYNVNLKKYLPHHPFLSPSPQPNLTFNSHQVFGHFANIMLTLKGGSNLKDAAEKYVQNNTAVHRAALTRCQQYHPDAHKTAVLILTSWKMSRKVTTSMESRSGMAYDPHIVRAYEVTAWSLQVP